VSAHHPWRNSCCPAALAILFGEAYDPVCAEITRYGGDYRSTTGTVLHAILAARYVIKSCRAYAHRFTSWRRGRRGTWVVVADCVGFQGHCIILRNGRAYDNGWTREIPVEYLTVRGAWQLGSKL
jgi:hypothetical protein